MNDIGARVQNHVDPLVQSLTDSPESEDRFWSEIELIGTPLVESDPKSSSHSFVTFVARLPHDGDHIVVQPGGFADPPTNKLDRIQGTNTVWACYRYRNDLRMHYSFPINMPLVSWQDATKQELEQIDQTFLTATRDEFNRKEFQLQSRSVSILELPAAPDESLVEKRQGIARGFISEEMLESKILGEPRKVWLYNSPVADDVKRKNLVLIFDGGWYLSLIPTQRILDNLFDDSLIEPTTAVFIDTPPGGREVDLSYNEDFARFVTDELVPWVQEHTNVSTRPENTFIGGSSLGGLSAMWMAYKFPHVFGNVICQAGVISKLMRPTQAHHEDNKLVNLFAGSARLPIRIWLEVGLLDDADVIVNPCREMAQILREKEYDVEYHEYAGGHDFALWRGTLAQALKRLLARKQGALEAER